MFKYEPCTVTLVWGGSSADSAGLEGKEGEDSRRGRGEDWELGGRLGESAIGSLTNPLTNPSGPWACQA
jgi:hypothetical protein